jgi:hypothetical protein
MAEGRPDASGIRHPESPMIHPGRRYRGGRAYATYTTRGGAKGSGRRPRMYPM